MGERATPPGDATLGLEPGDDVDHFRVRRLLGEGGMGAVYLARDTRLGRTVALKILRPEVIAPGESEHLVEEARITAQMNHPNIVVIHDLGEYRGAPYLALEYLDGDSLRERLGQGPPSLDEALRIGHAIASALAHAHERGIIHGDIKPGNVMLPRDGRVRVVDFGLASRMGIARREITGTPGYMAPEQWSGQKATDKADVFGFGVLMYQLLLGRHPVDDCPELAGLGASTDVRPPEITRGDLAHETRQLLTRCLEIDPAYRPSAAELVDGLDVVTTRPVHFAPDEGPFRGLRPFEESHAALFFGREEETDALLEQLRTDPVVAVVGASGAGKSSFVRAGVIPRLRARGDWTILSIRPGSAPFASLASAIREAHASLRRRADRDALELEGIEQRLQAQPGLANIALGALGQLGRSHVLLFVDQLEELFTHGEDEATCERFIELLFKAADDASDAVRVIFTLRDDFLGRLPDLRRLRVLRPLRPEELRRAIVRPVERLGYRFDAPELPERMLGEVDKEPGSLPLLQFACRALWDQRDITGRQLLTSAYEKMGGVTGALASHADEVLASLTPRAFASARAILLRLVTPEGTRLALAERKLLDGLDATAKEVLERLTTARLLSARRGGGDADAIYELTHEALISRWSQLATWIEESRAEWRWIRQLEMAADSWHTNGEVIEETWTADKLEAAAALMAERETPISSLATRFLAVGRARAERARRRRAYTVGGIITVLTVLLVAAALIATELRKRERAALEQAETLRLAAENVGHYQFDLAPFDWDPALLRPVPRDASELPDLTVEPLAIPRGRAATDRDLPPLPRWKVLARTVEKGHLLLEVEGAGVRSLLRFRGRGRAGQRCAPSEIVVEALPGWVERAAPLQRIAIPVPTCDATRSDTVAIPAGEFLFRGPAFPPSTYLEAIDPPRILWLPRYRIDRTEVSNAAFAIFAGLTGLVDVQPSNYPDSGILKEASFPDRPVTSIDHRAARTFCRFMGKRLPTSAEWEKAARGGLTLDELGLVPNPEPARRVPWGGRELRGHANMAEDHDPWVTTAPITAYPNGASPYGVLNLVGNVAEWTSTPARAVANSALMVTRGGHWDDTPATAHLDTVVEVDKSSRFFDYAVGVRCAVGEWEDEG